MKKWGFLRQEFSNDVRAAAAAAGFKSFEIEAMIGISFMGSLSNEDWMPTLRNYLQICIMLDLNPRDYLDE